MSNLAPVLRALLAQSAANNQLLRLIATMLVRTTDLQRDEDMADLLNRVSQSHQEFVLAIEDAVRRADEDKNG